MGIDPFLLEPLGQIFKLLLPKLGLGSVVISHQHGVLVDPQISFQTAEEVLGQMQRIPLVKGCPQALAQLVDDGLGHQGQIKINKVTDKVTGSKLLTGWSWIWQICGST